VSSHLSASSIWSFKKCPTHYRLSYVEGLKEAQEPEPLRMGTAWHKGLEVLESGGGMEAAVLAACDVYTVVPEWADPTAWAVEREVIANGLAGYDWYWNSGDESEWETLAVELQFDLPLVNPETGRATPRFRRVGRIDHVVRNKTTDVIRIKENKTTSRPIDSGSTYWNRLRMDTQSKFYIIAARDIQEEVSEELLGPGGSIVSGLLHDVFHKPTIRPKKLTQAESKRFVEDGMYMGRQFDVRYNTIYQPSEDEYSTIEERDQDWRATWVNNIMAEVEWGAEPKKADTPRPFAIRETPEMFGARFLADILAEPEKFFARKEVPFTDRELADFRHQIWSLQRTMAEMEKSGHWYENEHSCEAVGTMACPYCPICYNNVSCFDGVTVPNGFRRGRATGAKQ